jgi:hypothetical protein
MERNDLNAVFYPKDNAKVIEIEYLYWMIKYVYIY